MASPTISVIICAYSLDRWGDLVEALSSVQTPICPPHEIIVVIDHNPVLLARVQCEFPGVLVVENAGRQGASSSRNSGAKMAGGEVIAFLDDDAIATSNWLCEVACAFDNCSILGVGGAIEPRWASPRPDWFPSEFNWVVGGSYTGMPETIERVRNVWSGNMAIRRDVFESIGGFRPGFGKVANRSQPEDTDLCIRASQRWPLGSWLYMPNAVVLHKVPDSRATFGYFLRRCYFEGQGKALLAELVGTVTATSRERSYVFETLSSGLLVRLGDLVSSGRFSLIEQAAAIILGLSAVGIAYSASRLRSLLYRVVTGRSSSKEYLTA